MNLRTAKTLSPREYHAHRIATQRAKREALRQRKLREARDAIRRLAPLQPAMRRVYLFGSILRPNRFHAGSDIDIAIECDDFAVETPFARALENELSTAIDLRPLQGAIAEAVDACGEKVYG